MKFSYNWLQTFFDKKLPDPHELAERLTMHSFEVEAVAGSDGDSVFTIDVLPNRAHDCLSHYGIAREIATLYNIPLSRDLLRDTTVPDWPIADRLSVIVEDPALCLRYSALVIENVSVGPSPDWLVARLAAIGQRSINNIVDATNYVMFTLGQPLHAFDLKKFALSGGEVEIGVRRAQAGEKLMTLDDAERELPEGTLLIVDGATKNPIGIAGIKGGKDSGVDEHTEHLIIESANFDPVQIRQTARKLGIRTDASVRFEHGISPELTLLALQEVVMLIKEIAGETAKVVGLVDTYPAPSKTTAVMVETAKVNELLGASLPADEIGAVLRRLGFLYEVQGDRLVVTPPYERLDIVIAEDVIEEIGRIVGYEKILPVKLPALQTQAVMNKKAYYITLIRRLLVDRGFSEVYTYAFGDTGTIRVANPIASDKQFLRQNLALGLSRALEYNGRHADLLGLDGIKIFEIGTVFDADRELTVVGIAVAKTDAKGTHEQESQSALLDVLQALEVRHPEEIRKSGAEGIFEIDLETLMVNAPEPSMQDRKEIAVKSTSEHIEKRFKPISPYPFVLRDIAVWVAVSAEVPTPTAEAVMSVITEKAGALLVQKRLFDTFQKDGRISYAFRLVFQSHEKTLTDDEVGLIMWNVTTALNEREGWEVR